MTTLAEEFPKQQARVREVLKEYLAVDGTPGVNVKFAIAALEGVLRRADQAAMSGDVVAMLRSHEELKGCE